MNKKLTKKKRRYFSRGVYLLPNLFTTAALAFGFLSINFSMDSHFELAAIFIIIAAILDALDGRIARLTNTQSEFGAQFDSLADMVSFGVAPAILAYAWNLNELGKFGAMMAFMFGLSTAIRLARFNVTSKTPKSSNSFKGLPCPAGAVGLVSPIWYLSNMGISGSGLEILTLLMILITVSLMVSALPYLSFKKIGFRKVVSFWRAILLLIAMTLIFIEPPLMVMIYSWAYITLALFIYLFKSKNESKKNKTTKTQNDQLKTSKESSQQSPDEL